jgi:hypothetical protein
MEKFGNQTTENRVGGCVVGTLYFYQEVTLYEDTNLEL